MINSSSAIVLHIAVNWVMIDGLAVIAAGVTLAVVGMVNAFSASWGGPVLALGYTLVACGAVVFLIGTGMAIS